MNIRWTSHFAQLLLDYLNAAPGSAGTGAGYLINNVVGYAAGSTSLALDGGSGTILAGDMISIARKKYTVATALTAGVVVIAAPGLAASVADNEPVTVFKLPSISAAPRYIFNAGATLEGTAITFFAQILKRKHPRLLPVLVEITIESPAKGDAAVADETLLEWQGNIRSWMDDTAQLSAWLVSLPESRRRGWRMINPPILHAETELEYDNETGKRTASEFVKLTVEIEEE